MSAPQLHEQGVTSSQKTGGGPGTSAGTGAGDYDLHDAGLGLMAFGGGLEGLGAMGSARDRAKLLENEAEASLMNARLALQDAKFNAEKQSLESSQVFGSIQAGYAASGVTQDSGSALAVLQQSHINAELDRLNILHGGAMDSYNYRNRAHNAQLGADAAMRAGKMDAFATVFKTGASLALLA